MAIDSIFNSASSIMTVISLVTFLGILCWTFLIKRSADFDLAASTPFADEAIPTAPAAAGAEASAVAAAEQPHV